MKCPSFSVGSKVKIVSREFNAVYNQKSYSMYGWCGEVIDISGFDDAWELIPTPYTPENYPTNWQVDVKFISPIDGEEYNVSFHNYENQLEEEFEIVSAISEMAGKTIATVTAKLTRKM